MTKLAFNVQFQQISDPQNFLHANHYQLSYQSFTSRENFLDFSLKKVLIFKASQMQKRLQFQIFA
jgi:hypothetical protein